MVLTLWPWFVYNDKNTSTRNLYYLLLKAVCFIWKIYHCLLISNVSAKTNCIYLVMTKHGHLFELINNYVLMFIFYLVNSQFLGAQTFIGWNYLYLKHFDLSNGKVWFNEEGKPTVKWNKWTEMWFSCIVVTFSWQTWLVYCKM